MTDSDREPRPDIAAPVSPDETMTFRAMPDPAADTGERPLRRIPSDAGSALPAGTALLVVTRGPNEGARFLLDAPVTTVGRHTKSEIFLDDVTVSRRHAEFRQERGGYAVHDVGSLNGTYLNRQRIDHALLHAGDEVQIGKFRMIFEPSTNRAPDPASTPVTPASR